MRKTTRSYAAAAVITLVSTLFAPSSPSEAAVGTLYAVTGAGNGEGDCGGTPSSLYTIDPTTGAAALVAPVMIGATQARAIVSLAFHPSTGTLYAIANGMETDCSDDGDATLMTIDPVTGAATIVGTQGSLDGQFPDMTFDPFGTLYAWNEDDSDSLWTIDITTGTGSRVNFGPGTAKTGIASDSLGRMYLKSEFELYRLNPTNAAVFGLVELDRELKNILSFDPNDVLFSGNRTTGGFSLYTIDLTDGSTTLIGSNTVTNIGAIEFERGTVTAPPISDLSMGKVVDVPNPVVGTDVVFTLTVYNDGPDAADNVVVEDILTAGYAYVSSSGDGSYDDTTGIWSAGTVAASSSISIEITATVVPEEFNDYTNYAEIIDSDSYDSDSIPGSGFDGEDDYASVTPVVQFPKLFSISRDAGELWIVDPEFNFIDTMMPLTIDNNTINSGLALATQPETGTLFSVLNLADGRVIATIDPATGEATSIDDIGTSLDIGALAFGADQTTLYAATVNGGSEPNVLYSVDPSDGTRTQLCTLAEGSGRAMAFSNGLIYVATMVCPFDCFVQFEIIDPASFPASADDPCGGTTVDTDLFFRDPHGMTVESDAGGTVTLLLNSFTELYRIEITSGQATTTLAGFLSHNSNGLAFTVADVKNANLSAGKTSTKTRVKGKKFIEYTVSMQNPGPSSISNAQLLDNLPVGTTYVSSSNDCQFDGGSVTCSTPELSAGVTMFFTITVQVTCKKCSSITNHVAVSADDTFYDYPFDNVGSTTTSVKGKF